METRRIEAIKPKNEKNKTRQNNFGGTTKYWGPVITETDLEFAKISLRAANVQKLNSIFFFMS